MKKILIILLTVMTVKSFATVIPVNIFSGDIACSINDTIRFETTTNYPNQVTTIYLQTTSGLVFVQQDGTTTTQTPTTGITPDGNGKLADYKIQGNETRYSLNGGSFGNFTILSNTNTATGIDDLTNPEVSIKTYPNPCVEELSIFSSIDAEASLIDVKGKKFLSIKLLSGDNRIKVSSLPSGIYLVTIRNKSIRIVKE